jgi:predicted nucleic acid-binding protein
MTCFLDSSVLVATAREDEPLHEGCVQLFADRAMKRAIYSHALAECFATLTGGAASSQRIPAAHAVEFLASVAERCQIIALSPREMLATMASARERGVRGGAIYDLLHLAAARKARPDWIYTCDVQDFRAFAPDLAPIITAPV